MPTNDPAEERHYRGPLPAWPAKVDLPTWLEMSSEDRAGHLRRHAEEERDFYLSLGMDEARMERQTKRMVAYWDEIAAAKARR